jgi:hypothetical protein
VIALGASDRAERGKIIRKPVFGLATAANGQTESFAILIRGL